MLKTTILNRLTTLGQKQLNGGIYTLTHPQQQFFLSQLNKYDSSTLEKQRAALFQKRPSLKHVEPPVDFDRAGSTSDAAEGTRLIEEGKVGCLILAGGQASRLSSIGPKGTFPISPVKGKTLFQLFFEKTLAASVKAGRPLSIAVMTSPLNHLQTETYLESEGWFGLARDQVDLFSQGTLPFLDNRGNWLLEAPGKLAEGPDGNGGSLKSFFESGLWAKWQSAGIEYLNIILVDNPLADPFDAELCGYHCRRRGEITLKCVMKSDPEEKVGLLALEKGKLKMVEYSELSEEMKHSRFSIANTGLFCLSMDFIKKASSFSLPLHAARKKGQVLLATSKGACQEMAMVWKCETFIFDHLENTERAHVLIYPRETAYAPLKNASGESSPETVRAALLASDRQIYQLISGLLPPDKPFELDQAFYYPTPQLREKWKGRPLPDADYIEN